MNWTLQSMRDLNNADPLGGLGPRVERKPEAAPAAPEPVGVYTGPDGKMRTNLPLPPGPATPPIWPFPTHPPLDTTTEEPGAHGFLRVGDKVRVIALPTDADSCGSIPNGYGAEMIGRKFAVKRIGTTDFQLLQQDICCWWLPLDGEGRLWERVA